MDIETLFNAVHKKLDKLDEAIRGNGKLGILTRLALVEEASRRRSKREWLVLTLITTTAATATATLVATLIAR